MEKTQKALGVFSKYTKRCKSVNISEDNNMNYNFFYILTNYTIWDGLSQKTISRYCPFKRVPMAVFLKRVCSLVAKKFIPRTLIYPNVG
jgi:hypothetical protein